MQHKIIITFLFSIISIIGYGQVDQHHRIIEAPNDTIFNHMESTTTTGEVISIGFRQFESEKQTLVLATLDAKSNVNWQKEIDFGRDTTTIVGVSKIDINSTGDSILFACVVQLDGQNQELFGRCAKDGSECVIKVIGGGDSPTDIPNVAGFIDSTEIILKSGVKPTIARVGLGEDLLWSRSYDFQDASGANVQTSIMDIATTIDSTIVLADDGQQGSFFAAELDSNGVQLWSEAYSIDGQNMSDITPSQIIKLDDMSSAIAGNFGTSNTDQNGFIMVVDTFGEPIFANQVLVEGNPTKVKNVLQTSDGTLWIAGTYTDMLDSTLYFTTNITLGGVVNWTTSYPAVAVPNDANDLSFTSLKPVEIGGAFLTGHGYNAANNKALNIMKHNELGETPCSDTISLSLVTLSISTDTLTTEVENGGMFFTDVNFELKATNMLAPPTLTIVDAYQFCPNEPIDTFLVAVVPQVTEITYQWGDEDGIIPLDNDSLNIIEEGQYSVTVTIAEDVCYQMCDTIEVTRINPPMAAITISDLTQCIDGSIEFENVLGSAITDGRAPFTFLWSTTEITETINVTEPGVYSLTVTDACGEISSASITAQLPVYSPQITINQSALDCDNNMSIDLTAIYSGSAPNVGTSILWSTGETESTITVTESGVYSVTIDDNCGLSATNSIEITFTPQATEAEVSFETNCDEDNIINSTVTFSVDSDQPDDISIQMTKTDDNGTQNIINPLDPQTLGNYSVFVTNSCGEFLDSLSVDVTQACDGAPFAFPKVFFPNANANINEQTFGPIPEATIATTESDTLNILERITDIEFKVFNRWGEEVYSVDSEDNSAFLMPWDGTHKGDPAPSEVYIWYFSYTLDKGTTREASEIEKGDITLVR